MILALYIKYAEAVSGDVDTILKTCPMRSGAKMCYRIRRQFDREHHKAFFVCLCLSHTKCFQPIIIRVPIDWLFTPISKTHLGCFVFVVPGGTAKFASISPNCQPRAHSADNSGGQPKEGSGKPRASYSAHYWSFIPKSIFKSKSHKRASGTFVTVRKSGDTTKKNPTTTKVYIYSDAHVGRRRVAHVRLRDRNSVRTVQMLFTDRRPR